MYSICSKTLASALAALWVVLTAIQPVPQTTSVDSNTLPHLPAGRVILGEQFEEPVSVELRVPTALVNVLLTEKRSSETIDLRVPGALVEHLYSAGQVSGRLKSPILRHEILADELSVAPH
jgi:hypothetical protein